MVPPSGSFPGATNRQHDFGDSASSRVTAARIRGDGDRRRARVFGDMRSHYLFEDHLGRPSKGNDKGNVKNLVGFIRRDDLVPFAHAETSEAPNGQARGAMPFPVRRTAAPNRRDDQRASRT